MAFDPKKIEHAASCQAPGILYALCHDADNAQLFGAGADWSVYRVDLGAEEPKAEQRWTSHENYVSALVYREGEVISSGYDGRIIWTEAETGEQVRAVDDAHQGWIRDLILLPDSKRLASIGDDMLVKLWDAGSGELLDQWDGHEKQTPQGYATALYALAATPDGKHVASADRIGGIRIWEVDGGKPAGRLEAPAFYTYDSRARVRSIGGIRSLCFSPDGALAIGGIGKVTNVDGFVGPARIELWDWQAGKRTRTCQDKHKAVLNAVLFHPDGSWMIAAGGGDSGGVLAVWDREKEAPLNKSKPKGHIQRLILDSDSNRLYASGHDGFQIWRCGEDSG